ncbi:MAG TPA: hypothetical protein VM620_09745 [Hyphomicrobium sp.]|nr:hypothetical protein [Hyphomicrobium sp.]
MSGASFSERSDWEKPIPTLDESDDRHYFLDTRRQFRLRRDGSGQVAAVHRDGAKHLVPWTDTDPLPTSEGFAERIFNICEAAATGTP